MGYFDDRICFEHAFSEIMGQKRFMINCLSNITLTVC